MWTPTLEWMPSRTPGRPSDSCSSCRVFWCPLTSPQPIEPLSRHAARTDLHYCISASAHLRLHRGQMALCSGHCPWSELRPERRTSVSFGAESTSPFQTTHWEDRLEKRKHTVRHQLDRGLLIPPFQSGSWTQATG